jgi:hypothetical protein
LRHRLKRYRHRLHRHGLHPGSGSGRRLLLVLAARNRQPKKHNTTYPKNLFQLVRPRLIFSTAIFRPMFLNFDAVSMLHAQ